MSKKPFNVNLEPWDHDTFKEFPGEASKFLRLGLDYIPVDEFHKVRNKKKEAYDQPKTIKPKTYRATVKFREEVSAIDKAISEEFADD